MLLALFGISEKRLSIQAHLGKLLNARRGSIAHMPDYGLSDVSELYAELPYSQHYLIEAVTLAITKYEPRLHNITVHALEKCGLDCVLSLEIQAEMRQGEKLKYGLLFESGGIARVLE